MSMTKILKSYYRESIDFYPLCNYRVLRAGHITTDPDYKISRRSVVGHEFIFCINGAGWVEFNSGRHYVHQNQLVWLPVKGVHTHYPDTKRPWEIYWIRVDGGKLDNLVDFLQVPKHPVFLIEDTNSVLSLYDNIFTEMTDHSFVSDIQCDELIAKLLGVLTRVRSDVNNMTQDPVKHRGLINLLHQMQSHYAEEWTIEKIAAECNVSKSQLFRLFRTTFDQSPAQWLKSYRLSQSRRMLVDSENSISEIAFEIGYKDPLHFSRDFKKSVGVSPSQFRRNESQEGY